MTVAPTKPPSRDSLKLRLLSSAVGLPVLLAAVWGGNPWVTLLTAVIAMLALREFLALGPAPRVPVLHWVGYFWGLSLIVSTPLTSTLLPDLVATGLLASLTVFVLLRRRDTMPSWAWMVVGVAYTCLLLSFAPLLRVAPAGREWLLLALLGTFAADTGAYFTGKLIGRHKMAPSISPGKTWEGFVGGVLFCALAVVALGRTWELPLAVAGLFALGIAVAVAAAVGDLAESLLKRSAGVKEAGALVPGHGGLLDRLDSVLFTVPLVYYVATVAIR